MTSIDRFAVAVRAYCGWAEGAPAGEDALSGMLATRRHLSSLYAMAVDLPDCETDWTDRELTHDAWTRIFQRFGALPVGYYEEIFDPLAVPAGEAGLGDLADDLADIWRDLKEGLVVYDEQGRDAACACWRQSFNIHWGMHATKALAVIQFWISSRAQG